MERKEKPQKNNSTFPDWQGGRTLDVSDLGVYCATRGPGPGQVGVLPRFVSAGISRDLTSHRDHHIIKRLGLAQSEEKCGMSAADRKKTRCYLLGNTYQKLHFLHLHETRRSCLGKGHAGTRQGRRGSATLRSLSPPAAQRTGPTKRPCPLPALSAGLALRLCPSAAWWL